MSFLALASWGIFEHVTCDLDMLDISYPGGLKLSLFGARFAVIRTGLLALIQKCSFDLIDILSHLTRRYSSSSFIALSFLFTLSLWYY